VGRDIYLVKTPKYLIFNLLSLSRFWARAFSSFSLLHRFSLFSPYLTNSSNLLPQGFMIKFGSSIILQEIVWLGGWLISLFLLSRMDSKKLGFVSDD
jgi:hypothetical protein